MSINRSKLIEILEYLDMFGTKPGFYAEKKHKFYTVSGGLLTMISILLSLTVFIIFNLDDLCQIPPQTTLSLISSKHYKKIQFGKEKIWIPIRIADYYSQYVNPEGLIYPIFEYGFAERQNKSKPLEPKMKILNYKLCNETSMINKPDIYNINTPLNELFCIDMDNLEIGGAHDTNFIGYVKGDFFYCQNGDYFNETNTNCTNYEKVKERIGENNSLVFELYYPEVQFQPNNYDNPIIVFYKTYSYRFSKYSNKLDRLILQEYKLKDDKGFFNKKIKNSSYWGLSSLEGHYYATKTGDITKESSTSRLYSFYIYLETSTILYERKYKKFLSIVAEGLPLIFVVFTVFENIAKIFKLTEENKTMIELLFENLKEKPNKFEKHLNEIKNQENKETNLVFSKFQIDRKNNSKDHSKSEFQNSLSENQKYLSLGKLTPTQGRNINVFNLNSPNLIKSKIINPNNFSNFIKNKRCEELSSNILMPRQNNIFNSRKPLSFRSYSNFNSNKIKYVTGKLFPYRFYFFSTCIRSVSIKKNNYCFSEKFSKVYTFLTQILDISTYLILQREFNILKNTFLDDKKKSALFEQNSKINVNDRLFIRNINQSLASQNFHIFTQNKVKERSSEPSEVLVVN